MPVGSKRRTLILIRIFKYECRRLLWNKFFFGFFLVTLFYGWQILTNVTILGVSRTAPFSPWSFGDYLCRMIPLLWIGSLFFLTFFHSARARRAAVLTNTAPAHPGKYAFARCAAAAAGTGLLMLAALAEAAVFYGGYFGWHNWKTLAQPAFISLAPPLIFALGSGWCLGKIKGWLLYIWMLVPFVCMALPLPEKLGIWNGSFFSEYPKTLGTLDPEFSLPAATAVFQGVILALGILLIVRGVAGKEQKRDR